MSAAADSFEVALSRYVDAVLAYERDDGDYETLRGNRERCRAEVLRLHRAWKSPEEVREAERAAYLVGLSEYLKATKWQYEARVDARYPRLSSAPAVPRPDLAAFARTIFENDRDDWDGGDLQELGVKTGVLVEVKVSEPCGEHCPCAEMCEPENGPWTCYRLHPSLVPMRGQP